MTILVQDGRRNVAAEVVLGEMLLYEDHYGSQEQAPPKVFVGTQYLAGAGDITERLVHVVAFLTVAYCGVRPESLGDFLRTPASGSPQSGDGRPVRNARRLRARDHVGVVGAGVGDHHWPHGSSGASKLRGALPRADSLCQGVRAVPHQVGHWHGQSATRL